MATAVNGAKAGKHVSQIAVGGPAPSRKESVPSTSACGGDERHFNLAVINDESTEVKKPVNGGNIENELGDEFGKATLSKSAPVADIVRERLTSEVNPPDLNELANGNGHHEASAPSSDSTASDEKSSHSSSLEFPEPSGAVTSWTLFAQAYFQFKGAHTYLCSALQQPLLPKKDRADVLASLAAWVSILRIMGDLPESDQGETLDVAGSAPAIISQVKQSFQKKYTKRDVDEAYKKYSELFKDPSHSDVKNIPFLSDKVSTVLEKIQYVCALGIYKPELRDEIFCQVCKQLTNNPSLNSSVRGWVLLHLLAGCFAPTERFFSCFLHFLQESSPISSCRVERAVRRTAIVGTRGYPPSWLEFQASKNGKPILIPMSVMNGQRLLVEADSASTVQELTHQICHKVGLQDSSGFSIYITLMQRISCLGNGTHRVMDAVAECEQHTKQSGMRESSSSWRLYFRKEYFLPWQNPKDDPVSTDLIYQQIMRGVSAGEYKSKKDEDLAKLAAQRYFIENPGTADTTKLQTFLTGWLPENNKKTIDLTYWTSKVMNVLQNDIPKDRNKVREVKCDVVNFAKDKWHSVFSRFYDAHKIQNASMTWQNVILGLNNKGLEIMDEKEDVKSTISFIEITDVSKGRHTVTISSLRSEDFVVSSNHADDLFFLLTMFMDGLRRKSKYGIAVQDSTQIAPVARNFLLTTDVQLNSIYQINLENRNISAVDVMAGNPSIPDYDNVRGELVWWDKSKNTIMKSSLDGTDGKAIKGGVRSVGGLAIDHSTGNVFYASDDKIYVTTNSGNVYRKLLDGVNIGPIQVDSKRGILVWIERRPNPKIVRSYMDGTNDETVVSNSTHSIVTPMDLAIDNSDGSLVWCDDTLDKIDIVSMVTLTSRTVISNRGEYPVSVAVLGEFIYYIARDRRSITKISKLSGSKPTDMVSSPLFGKLLYLTIYEDNEHSLHKLCTNQNGMCSKFCLPSGESDRTCACEDGDSVDSDGLCPGDVQCPLVIDRGRISTTCRRLAGDMCEFVCSEDYQLGVPEASRLLCGSNGKWNQTSELCKVIKCQDSFENGNMASGCSLEVETTCGYTCHDGYIKSGSASLVCNKNGAWNEEIDQLCKREDNRNTAAIIGGAAGSTTGLVFIILVIVVVVCMRTRRNKKNHSENQSLNVSYVCPIISGSVLSTSQLSTYTTLTDDRESVYTEIREEFDQPKTVEIPPVSDKHHKDMGEDNHIGSSVKSERYSRFPGKNEDDDGYLEVCHLGNNENFLPVPDYEHDNWLEPSSRNGYMDAVGKIDHENSKRWEDARFKHPST